MMVLTGRDRFGKITAATALGFTLALELTCTVAVAFSLGDADR